MTKMHFKQFLTEATTGAAKWEKYFADNEQFTKMKTDSPLYTLDGKAIPKMDIKKGEVITVPVEDKYNPKIKIIWNDNEYRVSIAAIDKPIAAVDKMQLKPDYFNITGEFKASTYKKDVLRLIAENNELNEETKDYLIALINHAFGENNLIDLKASHDLIAPQKKLLNTINKDFLEIIGPVIASQILDLPSSVSYLFPTAGNEPLYDFKIINGKEEMLFSSKTSKTSSTNTLKTAEILVKVKGVAKFKKKKNELKVLEIIANTPIKDTPAALAKFLNEEFGVKIDVPSKADLGALVKVERQIVDILNSKLDFTDMINFSLPQLWFIKLKINPNGEIGAPVIQHSSEIKKAKLRSKNSPGHFVDRLGFQI